MLGIELAVRAAGRRLVAAAFIATLVSCASAGSLPAHLGGALWTMYRGDLARDGHPPDATLTAAQAARLKLAWTAHLSGAVDGSPAVSSGLIVAGSQNGELAAYDENTGRLSWNRRGLGPISGSPAISDGRVFAATLSGHVHAFRLTDGREIWDWKAPGTQPALWSSPTIYRALLLIGVGSQAGDQPLESGRVVALDAASGRERWLTCAMTDCAPGGGIWSTPSIDAAGRAYVGVGNPIDGLLAFDATTGQHLWQYSFYADAARDLDVGASPVLLDVDGREAVAVGSVAGIFKLFAAANGNVVWSDDLVMGGAAHGLIGSPAYDGASLYVPSASPLTGIFALRPTDGAVQWRYETALPVYSSPAVASGVLVFGTGAVFGDTKAGAVVALSIGDGHMLWSYDTHSAARSSPAVAGSLVVIGDSSGDLFAFRPA
jgi:outer membrane protein assembly factor BamB